MSENQKVVIILSLLLLRLELLRFFLKRKKVSRKVHSFLLILNGNEMVKGRVILSTWIESLPVNGLYLSSKANESMSVCHLPHWVPFDYRRECIFFKDLSGKVISNSYLDSIRISLIKSSRHGGALPMIKQNQNLFIRSFYYCYL